MGTFDVVSPDGLGAARLKAYAEQRVPPVSSECSESLSLTLTLRADPHGGLSDAGRMTIGMVRGIVDVRGESLNGQSWQMDTLEVVRSFPLSTQPEREFVAQREAFILVGRAAIDHAVHTVYTQRIENKEPAR